MSKKINNFPVRLRVLLYHAVSHGSPVEVQPYPSNDFLDGVVWTAWKVQAILDSTRQPRLYAAKLERSRLRLLYFGQVHLQEVLTGAAGTRGRGCTIGRYISLSRDFRGQGCLVAQRKVHDNTYLVDLIYSRIFLLVFDTINIRNRAHWYDHTVHMVFGEQQQCPSLLVSPSPDICTSKKSWCWL